MNVRDIFIASREATQLKTARFQCPTCGRLVHFDDLQPFPALELSEADPDAMYHILICRNCGEAYGKIMLDHLVKTLGGSWGADDQGNMFYRHPKPGEQPQ